MYKQKRENGLWEDLSKVIYKILYTLPIAKCMLVMPIAIIQHFLFCHLCECHYYLIKFWQRLHLNIFAALLRLHMLIIELNYRHCDTLTITYRFPDNRFTYCTLLHWSITCRSIFKVNEIHMRIVNDRRLFLQAPFDK